MTVLAQFRGSGTWWVTAANILMGIVVLVGVLVAILGVVHQSIDRRRKRRKLSRELDRDLEKLVAEFESYRPDYDGSEKDRPPQ